MIKDSGGRREFESGAVRDIQEGKGRCDLLPISTVANLMNDCVIGAIADWFETKNVKNLYDAIRKFCVVRVWTFEDAILEVSIHFEEGAKKYGERNWEKGLPVNCYIDSAIRHYLKWQRGDNDEPHDRAFVWNLLCCIWTIENNVG